MERPSIALIGSFHDALSTMEKSIEIFNQYEIEVVNPLDTKPIDPETAFVRFKIDDASHSPEQIELEALIRILGASVVYVVCPEGYVGKTTSYEFGHVVAMNLPVYFSDFPEATFMQYLCAGRILEPESLAEKIKENKFLAPKGFVLPDSKYL